MKILVGDVVKNREGTTESEISGSDSRIKVFVVPTDEVRMIACEMRAVLQKS